MGKLFKFAIITYLIVYYILICIVTINRWRQYEVYYFDHGIFDQALWSVAHGKAPLIDHLEEKPLYHLGDHFVPGYYLLAPMYWVTNSYEALFYIQNLFVVGAAAVIAVLAWQKTKNYYLTTAVLISFTWFIGLQNAIIAGFHTELPGLFVLSLTLWFLEQKQWKRFFVSLFFLYLFKQLFVAIGLAIGLYLILKKEWKIGLLVVILSAIYYSLITNLVMPTLAGRPYQYSSDIPPIPQLFTKLIDSKLKLMTISTSFATFGFLPVFSPLFLPVIIQDWIVRFALQDGVARHDLGMHYNAMTSVLLAFGAIQGAYSIRNKKRLLYACIVVALSSAAYFQVKKFHGPIGLAFNKVFYQDSAKFGFLSTLINQIPTNGIVMAPNNLAVRMTHTHEVMLLRSDYRKYMPQTIVLDTRTGQSPNNYWPLPSVQFNGLYSRLQKDPNYREVKITNDQIYFTKLPTSLE